MAPRTPSTNTDNPSPISDAALGIEPASGFQEGDSLKSQEVDNSFKDKDEAEAAVQSIATGVQPLGTTETSVQALVHGIAGAFEDARKKGESAVDALLLALRDKSNSLVQAVSATVRQGPASQVGLAEVPEQPPLNETAAYIMEKTGMSSREANSMTAPGSNL